MPYTIPGPDTSTVENADENAVDDPRDNPVEDETTIDEKTLEDEGLTTGNEADALRAYQADNPLDPVTALNYDFNDPELLTDKASSSTHSGTPTSLTLSRHPTSTINAMDPDAVNLINSINPNPKEPLDTDSIINAVDSLTIPASPNAPPDPSPRPTFADGIFTQTVDGDDDLSHQEVDEILMPFFTIKHSLTRFPTHLMPVPGTKNCRFCGEPWDSWKIVNKDELYASRLVHMKECSLKALQARKQPELDSLLQAAFQQSPHCPWLHQSPKNSPCPETTFSDAEAWAKYLSTQQQKAGSRTTLSHRSL